MSNPSDSRRRRGSQLVMLAGALGAAIAAYDYVTISSGIDHSGGTILVLGANLLLVFGGLMVLLLPGGLLAGIFAGLVFLGILGTGFAAYMLESGLIMSAMVIAAAGALLIVASDVWEKTP